MDSLRRIVQALRHSSQRCEQFAHLTSAQFFMLQQISTNKGLSVNELAALTYTHQSTVSEVVARLEKLKLVQRKRSKADARRIELSITANGIRKLLVVPQTSQDRIASAIKSLSPAKASQLAHLLTQLAKEAGFSKEQAHLFFEKSSKLSEL